MAWTTPGTATAGDVLTASFWNTQVRDNMVELAPFFATWTSFTPTMTNVTVGNGTHNSRYLKIGRIVFVNYEFTFGSTTSISGAPVFSVPFSVSGPLMAGQVMFLDAGTQRYIGMVEIENSSSGVVCQGINTTGTYATQLAPNATNPFTWTTNDKVVASVIYMTAS